MMACRRRLQAAGCRLHAGCYVERNVCPSSCVSSKSQKSKRDFTEQETVAGRQLESLGHKHDEMQARSREVSEAQGTGCRVVISMESL